MTTGPLQDRELRTWALANHSRSRPESADHRARADAERVELSRSEPDEFGVIFDEYFAAIHSYLARRLGADVADDLAAETFETAFRKRGNFDASRGTVRAWLYGIATRELSQHGRGESRRLQALARTPVTVSADGHEDLVADKVSAQASRRHLAQAVAALAPGDRDVLLLVALGDLRHDEVSSALGIPYGTVASRLNRVRKKLRAELSRYGPDSAAEHGSFGSEEHTHG